MIKGIEVDKSTVEYNNVHKNATINPRSVKVPLQNLEVTLWKGNNKKRKQQKELIQNYNENLKIYSHSYQYCELWWKISNKSATTRVLKNGLI